MTTPNMTHLDELTGDFQKQAIASARQSTWLIIMLILIFIGWASVAKVNETVRGSGTIVPSLRMQSIQSLEGGIVEKIHVSEGQSVEIGDLLIEISDTKAKSEFLEMKAEADALAVEVLRLEAEVTGQDLDLSSIANAEKAKREMDLFVARRKTQENAVQARSDELNVIDERIALVEPGTRSGSVSRTELLELQQQRAKIRGDIEDIKNKFTQESYKSLVEKRARLDALEQSMIQAQDRLSRTDIRSRVEGVINNISVTTVGGVVQPGEVIMEISPSDDHLLVEALVAPKDVAVVAPGMEASVKITAYDYSVYGDIPGEVVTISPDTVESPDPNNPTPHYRVMIKTEKNHLERNGSIFPMRPGMISEVDIKGEDRTVLNYIIRPIIKARLQ